MMDDKPNIICLCGSTKFKHYFGLINRKFTLEGYIVLLPGVYPHSDGINISDDAKIKLDELHKRKIDMSDQIFVIDPDGYIGNSTQSEIDYAKNKNKPITYLSCMDLKLEFKTKKST